MLNGEILIFLYLFQALHVFEVESNVKKAEIRIYKLKLQEKRMIRRQRDRINVNVNRIPDQFSRLRVSLTRTILMMRFFS